jgi:hypothetical protein
MNPKCIVCWIAALLATASLLDGGGGDQAVHLLAGVAVSYLCFRWYRADSDARGYRRSRGLDVAMVAFTAGALPYYLMRSRGQDERLRALAGYAASVTVALLAVVGGTVVRV